MKGTKSRISFYGSLGVLGLAAAFVLSAALDQRSLLRRHIAQESSDVAWVVFLKGHGDRAFLEETIRSFPGIRSIRFISQEEALQGVQKDALLSQSLTLTGRNPFPESFDVRWDPFFLRGDFLTRTTEKVRALDGVDHVGYDQPRVERLALLQKVLHELDLSLLVIAWVGAFLLVVLLGRLLFFPSGPFPGSTLFFSTVSGFLGGALGVALAQRLLGGFSGRVLWSGAALGLLAALIQNTSQEP